VAELYTGAVVSEIEISQVKRSNSTDPSAGMPHQEQDDVLPARVVIAIQVLQNVRNAFRFESSITHVLAAAHSRERDIFAEAIANSINLLGESEERPERRQLTSESYLGNWFTTLTVPLSSPDAEAIEIAPGEFVQILDLFLIAPLEERFEAVLLAAQGLLTQLVAAGFEVHLDTLSRRERFEIVGPRWPSNGSQTA
jgi:hypothetical protein